MTRSLLAEGRRSTVYRVDEDGEVYALKVLNLERPSPQQLARFYNELTQTAALDGAGVRLARRKTRVDGRHALVLDFVDGVPWLTVPPRTTREVSTTLRRAAQAARVLAGVHAAGVVHRDIKPANLLVRPDGHVVLIDFASASPVEVLAGAASGAEAMEGTLAYIAPEQTGRTGRPVDERADLYALGATLFEVLTGALPFSSRDPVELVHGHLARTPPRVDQLNRALPALVAEIVARLLQKSADDRYQTADGLAADLERCADTLDAGREPDFALCRQDHGGRLHLSQRLYGRSEPLAALFGALDHALAGRAGLVTVSGASGVGKSALVRELAAVVGLRGGRLVTGKLDRLQRAIPYHGVLQALSELLDLTLAEGEEQLAGWRARIVTALGDLGGVLIDLLPALELVIGPQPRPPELGATETRRRLEHLVRALVRALAPPERPVVLFFDDLQWTDHGTLDLISAIATDAGAVLLVGGWRDGEVGGAHPVTATLEALTAARVPITSIHLDNLDEHEVVQLVGDALRSPYAEVEPLASELWRHTGGNPFFVRQVLASLTDDGLLAPGPSGWTWDLEAIRDHGVTDDIADLLAARLQRLPAATRALMQPAACIGHRFDLGTLAPVTDRAITDVVDTLWPAVQHGLLQPVGEAWRLAREGGAPDAMRAAVFAFSHDRVQQAVYELLSAEERPRTHHRIGRLLVDRTSADQLPERLFDIAGQLNLAVSELRTDQERQELARLDLLAGQRAGRGAAWDEARAFFDAAAELLGERVWTDDPATAVVLHTGRARAAYESGDLPAADALAEIVLSRASAPLDRAPAHRVRLDVAIARDDLAEALQRGLLGLADLGVRFPRRPSLPHILLGVAQTKLRLFGVDPATLADRPSMTDPLKVQALALLEQLVPTAFRSGTAHFPLIVLRMVQLSLRDGHTEVSPFAYGSYGIMLCGVLGDVEGGYRFGQLALELSRRPGFDALHSKCLFVFHNMIAHWKDPLTDSVAPLGRAWQLAVERGNTFDAVWAATYRLNWMFLTGAELQAVDTEIGRFGDLVGRDAGARYQVGLLRQVAHNLRVPSPDGLRLVGEHYDEAAAATRLASTSDRTEECIYLLFKLVLAVTFDRGAAGLAHLDAAEPLLEAVTSMPFIPLIRLYGALAVLDAARGDRRLSVKRARKAARQLAAWGRSSPANYGHQARLVAAELAWFDGRRAEARDAFDEAISGARASGRVNDEALVLSRAARFYEADGNSLIAEALRDRALLALEAWGAFAVVTQLRGQHPALSSRPLREAPSDPGTITVTLTGESREGDGLDLQSLMKAAAAMSSELERDKLLGRLIAILVENAGATGGALVVEAPGGLVVAATRDAVADLTTVGPPVELGVADGVCPAIVRYAARRREAVVVGDARADDRFSADLRVRDGVVRAIATLPLAHQGSVRALVYLEHSAPDAFTRARMLVVEVLAAQAAVALENAGLYAGLRGALQTQIALTEANARFVPSQFLDHLGRTSITEVELGDAVHKEMSVLFSDLRGYTTLVEGMDAGDTIRFLNAYLAHMEPAVTRNRGFIDSYIGDAVMALFDGSSDAAVRAGLEMFEALGAFNEARARAGQPPVSIGVGINTGPLMLGTMGAVGSMKCTVVGDSVNLASRIEAITKRYGTGLLISEHTRDRLAHPEALHLRAVDRVQVAGKQRPVELYEVYDMDPPAVRDAKDATAATWAAAREAYYAQRFDEVEAAVAAVLQRVDDPVTRQLAARCARWRATAPPVGWTGVEVLEK